VGLSLPGEVNEEKKCHLYISELLYCTVLRIVPNIGIPILPPEK
jgi:hypothetical protein